MISLGRISLDRRLALLLPAALLALLPLAFARAQQEPRGEPVIRLAPRTVILVRHAEKSTAGDPQDPELSKEGLERAEELARLLARSGVTRLVASEFKRTQATLAPLAAKLGLKIEARPAADLDALATELVSAEPGSVTVVAGHTNTIPGLAALLGVPLSGLTESPNGPMLGDDQYDRLFVIYLPPTTAAVKPTVIELHYGS